MARFVCHRDDEDPRYDISANTIEELRKRRAEGNRDFISRYYPAEAEDTLTGKIIKF